MRGIKQRHSHGFSTVELLVTLMTVGILFSAFVTTFVSIQNINKKSHDMQTANTAAFSKMQSYENTLYTNLADTTPTGELQEVEDFSDELNETLRTPRVGKVYINTVSPTLKHVVVSVEYGSGNGQQIVQYATFIQRNGVSQ